jgi:molecular chaperone GrpE
MSERGKGNGSQDETDDFVLNAEEADDLEAAFKDALDAVDRTAGPRDEPEVEAPVSEHADQLREAQDRLMRALADYDNFRKRVERERADDRRYQGFEVLRELLPVVDNLERALSSEGSVEDLKTGVRLTLKQVAELLERHGVKRIESVGLTFDPRFHEAISHHPDAEVEQPTVSAEHEAGYSMKERLLRAARVTVAMPAPQSAEEQPSE